MFSVGERERDASKNTRLSALKVRLFYVGINDSLAKRREEMHLRLCGSFTNAPFTHTHTLQFVAKNEFILKM